MMRIQFNDGNAIAIKGNSHFISRVTTLFMPIFSAYGKVGEINSEPHDQQRLEVEIRMAAEAQKAETPFTGKYVSWIPDTEDSSLCSRCAEMILPGP